MLSSKTKRNKNVTIDIQFHNSINDNTIGKGCMKNTNKRQHDHDNDTTTTNVTVIAQAGMSLNGIVTITLKKPMKLLNKPYEVGTSTSSNGGNRNTTVTTNATTTTTSTIVPYFLGLISFELNGKEIVQMRKQQYIERWCYNQSIRYTKPIKKVHNKQPTEYEFYSLHGIVDEFPISSYDPHTNSIHSGQYTFPFSIVLPNNLPTSVTYNATKDKFIVPSSSSSTKRSTILNTRKKRMSPGFKIEYVLSIKLQNKFRASASASSSSTSSGGNTKIDCTSCYGMNTSIVMIQAKSNLLPGDQSVKRDYPSDITFTSTRDCTNPENGKMFIACAKLDTVRINLSTNDDTDNYNHNSNHDRDCPKLCASSIPLRISCRNVSRVPIRQVNVNIIETIRWNRTNFCTSINNTNERPELYDSVQVSRSTLYMQPHDGTQRTICTIPNIQSSTIQIQRLGLFQRRLKNDPRWNMNTNNNSNNKYQQSIVSLCYRDAVAKVLRDEIQHDLTNTTNNDSLTPIDIPYNIIETVLDDYTNGRLIHIDHHLEIVFVQSTTRRRIRNMFSRNSSSSTTGTTTTTRSDPKIIIPICLYKNKSLSSSSSARILEDIISSTENSSTFEQDVVNNNNSYITDDAILPAIGTFETLSTRGWIHSSVSSSTSMIPQSSSITDSIMSVQAEPVHFAQGNNTYQWHDSHSNNNNNNDTGDNDNTVSIPLVAATMIHDEDNHRINSHRYSTRQDNSYSLPHDRYYLTATMSSSDSNDDIMPVPVQVPPVIPLSDLQPIPVQVPTLHDLQPIPAPKISR